MKWIDLFEKAQKKFFQFCFKNKAYHIWQKGMSFPFLHSFLFIWWVLANPKPAVPQVYGAAENMDLLRNLMLVF